ncbi:acetyl-CoA carboxylase carboxyltransferase subunit alpha [Spirochaeta lutea]|uniref:Acetyl-coenzyme A carboxylase carboxyl transferase subunit alpha n=1 Tax=Spirochaeta lutea TaxID=1480694 RepID=A0A098QVK0_9SPIO|nr:acetyl-CoA carboxylase carboxyltransferase subunit alpha [Spirochaeta lutea]KGE71418.1 acetyl-CoA carboxyl transferase [Spirochaeta lutea]
MTEREIRKKIRELKSLANRHQLDISEDLARMSAKLEKGELSDLSPWQRVELARHPQRPTTLEYIERMSDEYMELFGDRYFGDDPAMVGGIARIGGVAFTFIGHQRGKNMKENMRRNYGMAQPEGYRKALRLAHQAEKFGRPIITFVDTMGAYPGLTSEERGISEAIARNLKEFSVLKTPVITTIIGEGGSGGAIGIAVADKVFMLENSVYSVISPEGCASILLRDAKKAEMAAGLLKITAKDLLSLGIVDGVITEPPSGAHSDLNFVAARMKETILSTYRNLSGKKIETILKERSRRLLSYGEFHDPEEKGDGFFKRFFSW